jgi:hypothetical protein
MSAALAEYFDDVTSTDAFNDGFGGVVDFLNLTYEADSLDWVITNPPFNLAERFIVRSLKIARRGVAMLTRTIFIESVGRYEHLFRNNPPSRVAQLTERVPMVEGRLNERPVQQRPTHDLCGKETGPVPAS